MFSLIKEWLGFGDENNLPRNTTKEIKVTSVGLERELPLGVWVAKKSRDGIVMECYSEHLYFGNEIGGVVRHTRQPTATEYGQISSGVIPVTG